VYTYSSAWLRRVTDAMYSEVVGAKWNGNKWEVPCKTEINVTFSFGRQTFPVHPLDVVQKKANGTCFGAVSAILPSFLNDS
jgi:hypothetical protein